MLHCWQHLLTEWNIVVILVIDFHSSNDKDQLSHIHFWHSNGNDNRYLQLEAKFFTFFNDIKLSQGKVCTIKRWHGILNHLFMGCLLNNIYTKNYSNRTPTVEIIVSRWVVSFFETQYISRPSLPCFISFILELSCLPFCYTSHLILCPSRCGPFLSLRSVRVLVCLCCPTWLSSPPPRTAASHPFALPFALCPPSSLTFRPSLSPLPYLPALIVRHSPGPASYSCHPSAFFRSFVLPVSPASFPLSSFPAFSWLSFPSDVVLARVILPPCLQPHPLRCLTTPALRCPSLPPLALCISIASCISLCSCLCPSSVLAFISPYVLLSFPFSVLLTALGVLRMLPVLHWVGDPYGF